METKTASTYRTSLLPVAMKHPAKSAIIYYANLELCLTRRDI